MNVQALGIAPADADTSRAILKIVIMAVGGQGGGVLSSWIEAAARLDGRAVQMTSVAGVAQRTGATIYYIEVAPKGVETPVFSLAPAAGDVDVLIAAEMMEAGRAIQRGFVTPDRTVLIASTHRALAVSEKVVPGDGVARSDAVRGAAEIASARLIMADMEKLAVSAGSVISASLLGALAASDALPFARDIYETAIRNGQKGVDASLSAFAAGFDAALSEAEDVSPTPPNGQSHAMGPSALLGKWETLRARIDTYPEPIRDITLAGVQKVVDFQDVAYGAAYLDQLETILTLETTPAKPDLSQEVAKYLANAMAYDDVIGVADKKTRQARFDRIDAEMRQTETQVMHLTEFMHPRGEEMIGLLPVWLGRWVETHPKVMGSIDWLVNRGRRIRSDGFIGYTLLYTVAGLRRFRLGSLRHSVEQAHIARWLDRVRQTAERDYALAIEIAKCRRLIKGYSDTHARGRSKFERVLEGADLVEGRKDAAEWVRRLRDAALQDEAGSALDGALETVQSFAVQPGQPMG